MAKRWTLKEIILSLLETDEKCRDNDNRLRINLCIATGDMMAWVSYSIMEILAILELVNYQSMRDTRQVLQKKCNEKIKRYEAEWLAIDFIDIRGLEYDKRHKIGDKVRIEHQPTFEDKVEENIPRWQK